MESDLNLARSQVVDLAEEKRQLEEQLLRATERVTALEAEKTALADKVRAFETFYADRDAVHSETLTGNEQLQKELASAQASADVRAQHLEQAAERERALIAERDALRANVRDADVQIDALSAQVASLTSEKLVADKSLADIAPGIANLQHQLDEALATVVTQHNQIVDLQNQLAAGVTEKDQAIAELAENASMLEQSEARSVEATTAHAALSETVKQLEADKAALADQAGEHQRNLKKSERRAAKAEAGHAELSKKVKVLEDTFINDKPSAEKL